MQKFVRPINYLESQLYSMIILSTASVFLGAIFLFLQATGFSPDGGFLHWSNLWVGESKGFIASMAMTVIPD